MSGLVRFLNLDKKRTSRIIKMDYTEHAFERNDNDPLSERVKTFLDVGCGCSRGKNGNPCSKSFFQENILCNLNNCMELTREELDVVILSNIQACTQEHDDKVGEKRRSPRCSFLYKSIPICKNMFLQLYGISDSRFRALKEHYDTFGISPRTHGNKNKIPHNTLSHSTVVDIQRFITNYAEENGVLLPGRIPGYKSDDIQLLPSCESKMSVWKAYNQSCQF